MALEVNNQYDFFRKVSLNNDGHVEITETQLVGEVKKAGDAYSFYEKIKLNDDGSISVIFV